MKDMAGKFMTKGRGKGRKVIPLRGRAAGPAARKAGPIYSYSQEQAIADGILMHNPRPDAFSECTIITANLHDAISRLSSERSMRRVFEISPDELTGNLMLMARKTYAEKDFKGDDDRDFFALPPTEEGLAVWFVRNETGGLTAMLPEDY